MSLYPTRNNNFAEASQKRLKDDPRKHVYGNHLDSLLIEHSFPELSNGKHINMNDYNNKHITPNCWQPININHYRIIKKIGSGTYGSVFHAQSPNGRDVAVKQLCPMQNEKHLQDGFHITAIREIKILKSLQHTNIISLHDVICCKENVLSNYHDKNKKELKKGIDLDRMATYMIFEYMHHDLSGLLHNESVSFDIRHIKYFLCQILNALKYCHDTAMILHRDIKSSNLLVDNRGVVKIADFGLSRQFIPSLKAKSKRIAWCHESVSASNVQHPRHYTNRVVTLWYRAPELLLSDVHYTPAVDLWSVGCVFAELLFDKPIFTGKNEMEQWLQIIQVCGWDMNKEAHWISNLRDKDGLIAKIKKKSKLFPRTLQSKFSKFTEPSPQNKKYLDENGFDLLDSLLTMNPNERCDARQALQSEWFRSEPFPKAPHFLDKIQPSHDYEQRQQRKNGNYRNGNAQRRYQYNYNQYPSRNRDRSRSRSRERNDGNMNDKGHSVSLPPPIKRLPSIHPSNNHNVQMNNSQSHPVKQVVTLSAPKLLSNNNPVGQGHMRSGAHMQGRVGGHGGFKNGYNPDQPHTFYSRFKKPDELKGRSRF